MLKRTVTDLMEAWDALSVLAGHFGTSEPKLIFGRTRRGWYRPANRRTGAPARISLHSTPIGGWSISNTLVHEFAHHLHWTRTGDCNHNADFHRALTDVAAAWYGNPAEYCWHLEYATLKAAGPAAHPQLKIDTDALLSQL